MFNILPEIMLTDLSETNSLNVVDVFIVRRINTPKFIDRRSLTVLSVYLHFAGHKFLESFCFLSEVGKEKLTTSYRFITDIVNGLPHMFSRHTLNTFTSCKIIKFLFYTRLKAKRSTAMMLMIKRLSLFSAR
jgi:hypothetical protein